MVLQEAQTDFISYNVDISTAQYFDNYSSSGFFIPTNFFSMLSSTDRRQRLLMTTSMDFLES